MITNVCVLLLVGMGCSAWDCMWDNLFHKNWSTKLCHVYDVLTTSVAFLLYLLVLQHFNLLFYEVGPFDGEAKNSGQGSPTFLVGIAVVVQLI